MIYDSPEQKQYIHTCVKKCREWDYEQTLQLAQQFGQGIQDGQIIPIKDQLKAFPPPKPQATPPAGTPPPSGANGNRRTRRAAAKADKVEKAT